MLDQDPSLINEPDTEGNVPFISLLVALGLWQIELRELKMKSALTMALQERMEPGSTQGTRDPLKEVATKRYKEIQETMDLFLSKSTNIDKPNNFGSSWHEFPGVDEKLRRYIQQKLSPDRSSDSSLLEFPFSYDDN